MSNTHFVVTDGEYSDYHIKRVFSDKAVAGEYVSVYGGQIEEWPDSASVPDPYLWQARISIHGVITTEPLSRPEEEQSEYASLTSAGGFWCDGKGMNLTVYGRTKEEAVRIAGDSHKAALAQITQEKLNEDLGRYP